MTPRGKVQFLVCTAGCGIPLHPAAVEGTTWTTHPSCTPEFRDPNAPTPRKRRRR